MLLIIRINFIINFKKGARGMSFSGGEPMKAFNKRVNKRKATKVTLKNHRKETHPHVRDALKEATSNVTAARPEDIKMHQHY